MTIKFQADADLNQNIVTGVLRKEIAIYFLTIFDWIAKKYQLLELS